MKTTKSLIYFLCFFMMLTLNAYGQDQILLDMEGVKISYTTKLIKEEKRKNLYEIEVQLVNSSVYDYYYAVPMRLGSDGKYRTVSTDNHVASIKPNNDVYLFGNEIRFVTKESIYTTKSDDKLFEMKQGMIYTNKMNCRFDKDVPPTLVFNQTRVFKTLNSFQLKANPKMFEGTFVSNCGNENVSLVLRDVNGPTPYLQQISGGTKTNWVPVSDGIFVKEVNHAYQLSYNAHDGSVIMMTPSGDMCIWTRL